MKLCKLLNLAHDLHCKFKFHLLTNVYFSDIFYLNGYLFYVCKCDSKY